MKSEFKYPNELSESELEQVYAIHKEVYVSKGVGLDFDIWLHHLLNKRYHNVADKLLQLFRLYNSDSIDGYHILTEPVLIEGESWSKLIEVGSFPKTKRDSKKVFLGMYEELFSLQKNIIYFGEVGIEHHHVKDLLIESKLDVFYDVSKLDTVFKTFLQTEEFKLYDGEHGVEIKRKTFITPTYHGYVTVNDYRQTKNKTYGAVE